MKFSTALITCFSLSILLYGNDSLSIYNPDQRKSKEIYYSSYLGVYSVSPILTKEKSDKYDLKINVLSEKLNISNIDLNNLLLADTVSVPKVYSFLGGLYTKPKLTAEQKNASVRKGEIRKLKYSINRLNVKKSYLSKRYEKLISRDTMNVQIKLLWGFASWEEKKLDRIKLPNDKQSINK